MVEGAVSAIVSDTSVNVANASVIRCETLAVEPIVARLAAEQARSFRVRSLHFEHIRSDSYTVS